MVLDRLSIVEGASFDSSAQEHASTCLPNTRVELLSQVAQWAKDRKAASIFWLSGMAGTGKSTISRTVAQTFADEGRLGGSFFFKRGEADRSGLAKFFTTIVADLVIRRPEIASHVKSALEGDPSIAAKNAREQFDKLFLQPLLRAELEEKPIVIVVDALDECESEDDIKRLINLLSVPQLQAAKHIKIFLTSRPELPPRVSFGAIDGSYQDALLHAVPEPVIERDIYYFLEHELGKIREEYNLSVAENRQFSLDWPSDSDVRTLVHMAVPLFIFAATVCRFIADRKYGNPGKQLMKVLNYQSKSHRMALNETYQLVLSRQLAGLGDEEKEAVIQEFCNIVGPIIILETPLSVSVLARILDISGRTIDDRLDLLHSVLSIPLSADTPVRLLHMSFRDFLLDPTNREGNAFWVDGKRMHADMAANCLRVLQCLKENICNMPSPSTSRSAITPATINACLPQEVQYASLYWVHHVEKSNSPVSDGTDIHNFLAHNFLPWVESLSLIGRAYESRSLIETLKSQLTVRNTLRRSYESHSLTSIQTENSTNISQLLDDAWLFLGNFLSVIDSTPLQLYSSLLMFAPHKSKVRCLFKDRVKGIRTWPVVADCWDPCIHKLEGHRAWVQSVALSHDSALVASSSGDTTVRIWSSDTGECVLVYEGHHGEVNSVAFSHDSTLVASCDAQIRIWCPGTGELMRTLEGHDSYITSVAFSHDSVLLASASSDKSVRIWHVETGECLHILHGHRNIVSSVAFSHESKLLASASHDATVRIWDTQAGKEVRLLDGHTRAVNAVAFSHDSTLLASGSLDNTTQIWCPKTGKCLQVLEGYRDEVSSVSFSSRSTRLVSGSADGYVRLWSPEMGNAQTVLGRTYASSSIAFSNDSEKIAIGSYDMTVRLWLANLGEGLGSQTLERHGDIALSLALSHDATLVASASADNSLRIWSTATGKCLHTLDGHVDSVLDVTFSRDSQLVVSASCDKTYRIWSTTTGECIQVIDKSVTSTAQLSDESIRLLLQDFGAARPDGTLPSAAQQKDCLDQITIINSCYGFSDDRFWITKNGDKVLRLPVEAKPFAAIISGSLVVTGAMSGRVTIIGFPPETSA